MSKKSLTLAFCALCAWYAGATSPALAQSTDSSLLPVVVFVLDTSGSMNGVMDYSYNKGLVLNDGNTRFTKMIQEMAGTIITTPKNSEYNGYSKSEVYKGGDTSYLIGNLGTSNFLKRIKETRFPRLVMQCSSGICNYVTKFICGESYSGGICDYKLDSEGTYYESYGGVTNLTRNLSKGFDAKTLDEFAKNYLSNGIIQNYQDSVKFGLAAMRYAWSCYRYKYGCSNDANYVLNPSDGTITLGKKYSASVGGVNIDTTYQGILGPNPENAAPLIYPSVSDDPENIRKVNEAVIWGIRGLNFTAGGTPLSYAMQDVAAMFLWPDEGMIRQPKVGTGEIVDDSSHYACRSRAVILMTDGEDSSSGTGMSTYAEKLFDGGVKTYTIGYAFENIDPESNAAQWLNETAWKGGTCRTNGHTGDIISPDETSEYNSYNARYKSGLATPCFYNAFDGTALRQAMVSILNDLTQGYTSKNKVVSTTAIGLLSNTTTSSTGGSTYNTGWYNLYSGYRVTQGVIRQAGLQRETYTCNKESGLFEYNEKQFLDLNQRMEDRLAKCRSDSIIQKSTGSSDFCSHGRAIWVGNYKDDRYALAPGRLHFTEAAAGQIPKNASGSDYEDYLTSSAGAAETTDISASVAMEYLISPYECVNDTDCVVLKQRKENTLDENTTTASEAMFYMCDQGKCIERQELTACTASDKCTASELCLRGQCRTRSSGCSKHSDCTGESQVCHAGTCVKGTVQNGDMRDFIASQPLGTIEFGTPTIVAPPTRAYNNTTYNAFSQRYWNRDTIAYVAANDGMLHAFILGKNNNNTYSKSMFTTDAPSAPDFGTVTKAVSLEGEELWSFIPKAMLPRIKDLYHFGAQHFVNSSPIHADVYFPSDNSWHTVLVGGYRNGGRGYYALDVTDPADPHILWELDNQWQQKEDTPLMPTIGADTSVTKAQEDAWHVGSKTEDWDYPLSRLGYSYAEPVITNVMIQENGKDQVIPVAILPGGLPESTSSTSDDLTGKAVYIVRLDVLSGDSWDSQSNKASDAIDRSKLLVKEIKFDTVITGAPAVYPSNFNAIGQLIYFGDAKGNLHRIDISSSDTDTWEPTRIGDAHDGTVVPAFDPSVYASIQQDLGYDKITYAPAVASLQQTTTRPDIQIAFGTGDSSATTVQNPNYAALFVDHYNPKTGKYQLNNMTSENPENNAVASTQYKPLFLGFNTTGISDVSMKEQTCSSASASSVQCSGRQVFQVAVGGGNDPGHTSQGNRIETNQKMMGSPLIFNHRVYFATYHPPKSASTLTSCAKGYASIWQLDRTQNLSRHATKTATQSLSTHTDDLFEKKSWIDFTNPDGSGTGTVIYGLAMTPQMTCLKSDNTVGETTPPQVIAQTSGDHKQSGLYNTRTQSTNSKSTIESVTITEDSMDPVLSPSSWASVYE